MISMTGISPGLRPLMVDVPSAGAGPGRLLSTLWSLEVRESGTAASAWSSLSPGRL